MKTNIPPSLKIITPVAAILLFVFSIVNAQSPEIEWQNTIGGIESEWLQCIDNTSDGGVILGGYSSSGITGDKTEANLSIYSNFWIVKLDFAGNIEWQKTIGTVGGGDLLKSIKQTSDGGYILGGESAYGLPGDKSEPTRGFDDYWVVKLNSTGNIEWEKTIGGDKSDHLESIVQTIDGGYFMGGWTESGVSGDKTDPSNGMYDMWVVKLSGTGNIEWQNSIGGSNSDYAFAVNQVNDGGYIIGGYSFSNISGDKSENSMGYSDIWVVKLDNSGIIEWENTIGADNYDYAYSIQQTFDGGFIVGGNSKSGLNGDKTESAIGEGDYWVLKLDATGNIEWQKTLGTTGYDNLKSIVQIADSNFILGGYPDYTIIKINKNGSNVDWQKVFFGNGEDLLGEICQATDGGFYIGGYSGSGDTGAKTEPRWDTIFPYTKDYWVIKLYPENQFCVPPSSIDYVVMGDKAKIKWNLIDAAFGYRLRYRINGTEIWSFKFVHAKEFTILKSLDCNTEYEFQVMSVCSPDGSSHSDYTSSRYFTTESCRLDGEITMGQLNVYPNPASDIINIVLFGETGDAQIRIFNLNGEIVYENNLNIQGDYQLVWKAENISSGIYQLQIIINENNYTKKIVISK